MQDQSKLKLRLLREISDAAFPPDRLKELSALIEKWTPSEQDGPSEKPPKCPNCEKLWNAAYAACDPDNDNDIVDKLTDLRLVLVETDPSEQ